MESDNSGRNPYDSELAHASSAYLGTADGKLVCFGEPEATVTEARVHDELRGWLLAPQYSCVGAKAAFNSGAYRMGVYSEMTDSGALAGLARDLWTFTQEQSTLGSDFTTFAAVFAGPAMESEADFERYLWTVLQTLYDVDRLYSPADVKVAENPESGSFGFSFAGRGFFVIGLHPASSRLARRFAHPTLIFNAHFQFDKLKADGRYPKMQAAIRARETQ